jgi:hypothetical protein
MSPKRTFISIRISMEELKKINYLREHTDATTKASVLRKGLYALYDQEKQKYSGVPYPQPTES